jgi:hypothetical protein
MSAEKLNVGISGYSRSKIIQITQNFRMLSCFVYP